LNFTTGIRITFFIYLMSTLVALVEAAVECAFAKPCRSLGIGSRPKKARIQASMDMNPCTAHSENCKDFPLSSGSHPIIPEQ